MALPAKNLLLGYLPIVRWMLILRPAVVTATLGVAMLILPDGMIDKFPVGVVVFGTYLLTFLYWLTQRLSGISRTLLATQITFDIVIITVIIHYTGGYDSSFVGFYFLSIMCVSLFFRRIVTFLFSLFAVTVYLSYLGLFTPVFGAEFPDIAARHGIYLQALLYGVLMVAVGLFSSYYSERLLRKDTALSSALRLLREARLDTSDILQSMNNGLVAFDMSGRVMYSNQAAMKILRIAPGSFAEGYDSLLSGRAPALAGIIRRELSARSSGTEEEIEITDAHGNPIPIGLATVPLYDTESGRRGVIVNFKDLTEKQKLVEMIRQSDRMAAVGELSAAIAHEIRNPLASLCNAVELLTEEVDDRNGKVPRLVGIIERESARLQRITTEFLKFARLRDSEIQAVNLRAAVEEVVILIGNDPRKTGDVVIGTRIPASLTVYFDPDQLRQSLINVLLNSLEALEGRGEIQITLERKRKADDKYARLVITDTGPGFGDSLGRVFEPFFSTKKEGTGLGLALVRKMVVANRGRVFAKNTASGGAEIAIDIPLSGEEHG